MKDVREQGAEGGVERRGRGERERGGKKKCKNAPHAAITDVPARAVDPGSTRFSRHSIRRSSDAPSRTSLRQKGKRGRGA